MTSCEGVRLPREHWEQGFHGPRGGIGVKMHEKEGLWNPELTFGHLLTSTNYDDTQKRIVGGRNGYGA